MRSWLTYIFLSMVACATVLTSCNNVLDEEGIAECDDRTTVRLTISFGGDDGPMSRDVGNNPAPKDDDLDYTTKEQAEIVAEDIYALVVDASSGKFLYRIKDLQIIAGPASDNYYTRTLEGTMIQTTQPVKIVLLANLVQDGIIDANDDKAAVEAIIDRYVGQSITDLYDDLIYDYDGTTPWTLTGDDVRRIPMWGESQLTTVPPAQDVTLTCYLYRALAKVQIWVNGKQGIQHSYGDFTITNITVNNIPTKGYCVSQANFNSVNYTGITAKPYAAPWVPAGCTPQTVVYEVSDSDSNSDEYNDAREAYSDMIYIPEQINIDAETPVTITVEYSFAGQTGLTGTIEFKKDGTGDAFDVIRNHSYIFNIIKSDVEVGGITVSVYDWEKCYPDLEI